MARATTGGQKWRSVSIAFHNGCFKETSYSRQGRFWPWPRAGAKSLFYVLRAGVSKSGAHQHLAGRERADEGVGRGVGGPPHRCPAAGAAFPVGQTLGHQFPANSARNWCLSRVCGPQRVTMIR